jgi:hypothetical protein
MVFVGGCMLVGPLGYPEASAACIAAALAFVVKSRSSRLVQCSHHEDGSLGVVVDQEPSVFS